MAKGDNIVALLKASLDGDRSRVISIACSIAANEPPNSSLKSRVERLLSSNKNQRFKGDNLPQDLKGLVTPESPLLDIKHTVLSKPIKDELDVFLEDQGCSGLLHDSGLSVPNRVLLSGPPGNGKTTLAGAISSALDRPFYVVDFSCVISSHLGETGSNIAKVFRGVSQQPCVLLVDEMETLLCERSGHQGSSDVGEAKRIVSTLLMEIDRLPDHVILVGATNHQEMLDRAVIRRFDYHWDLGIPDDQVVDKWIYQFADRYPDIPIKSQMPRPSVFGKSLSDIEREVVRWCRRWVVNNEKIKDNKNKKG